MTGQRAQDDVERALQAAGRGDCVVIAEETSSANLRWAGNTLTTNGVQRSRRLTVIAISTGRPGPGVGVVSKAGVRPDQIQDLVAEAEQAAADASPAPDAQPLIGPDSQRPAGSKPEAAAAPAGTPGWDAPASCDRGQRARRVRRYARCGVRGRSRRRPAAVRVRGARHDVAVSRHLHRAAAAARPARGADRAEREVSRPDPVGVGRRGHPGLHRCPGRGPVRRAGHAAGLGGPADRASGRPL